MSTKKATLVVVTCLKDQWQFEMLIRSLYKFVSPCQLLIICNETEENFDCWIDWFSPIQKLFLKNFDVKIKKLHDYTDEIDNYGGWIRQQILKLFVSQDIDTKEYIVLDSKNFFIKATNITNIKRCAAHTNWRSNQLEKWIEYCCRELNYSYSNNLSVRSTLTPYIFKTHVVKAMLKKWKSNNHFIDWFITTGRRQEATHSEFVLYDIFEKYHGERNEVSDINFNFSTIWGKDLAEENNLDYHAYIVLEKYEKYDITVSGLHRSVFDYITLQELENFLKILECEVILPAITPFNF